MRLTWSLPFQSTLRLSSARSRSSPSKSFGSFAETGPRTRTSGRLQSLGNLTLTRLRRNTSAWESVSCVSFNNLRLLSSARSVLLLRHFRLRLMLSNRTSQLLEHFAPKVSKTATLQRSLLLLTVVVLKVKRTWTNSLLSVPKNTKINLRKLLTLPLRSSPMREFSKPCSLIGSLWSSLPVHRRIPTSSVVNQLSWFSKLLTIISSELKPWRAHLTLSTSWTKL